MDYEGYTFVFFIQKNKQYFLNVIYIMLLLFNRRIIFLKCMLPIFA